VALLAFRAFDNGVDDADIAASGKNRAARKAPGKAPGRAPKKAPPRRLHTESATKMPKKHPGKETPNNQTSSTPNNQISTTTNNLPPPPQTICLLHHKQSDLLHKHQTSSTLDSQE
jgi:hypothetical protein